MRGMHRGPSVRNGNPMTRLIGIATLLCSGLWLIGCGGNTAATSKDGKEAQTAGEAATEAGTQTELSVTPDTPPDQVVVAFLEARRSGDTQATAALLTSIARSETARFNIDVNNQAVPDLEFQVAKPRILKDNPKGAHVNSTWTETLPDGSKVSYEILWVLRREDVGWRVAGFAAELVPGTEPQFLNFEKPQDMLRKQEEALAAAQEADAAASSTQVEQAQAPTQEGDSRRQR